MKFILNKLPEKEFARISRYFIISIMKIDRITQKSVSIDGKQLEIGNKYAKEFLQKLKN
jgi:DNA-binding LytR/AlgR family response regulator